MSVKFISTFGFLFYFFFDYSLQQSDQQSAQNPAAKPKLTQGPVCNLPLLNALRLTGHAEGAEVEDSLICPIAAENNCCSRTDEIKIINSWNTYTKPKLDKFVDDVIEVYNDFVNLEPALKQLDPAKIDFHFDQVHWLKTNESQCFNAKYFLEQANYDLMNRDKNITIEVVKKFSESFWDHFSKSNTDKLIRRKPLLKIVLKVLKNTTMTPDLIWSLKSLGRDYWANTFISNFVPQITTLLASKLTLPKPKEGDKPVAFYNDTLKLYAIVLKAHEDTSKELYVKALQARAAKIHMNVITDFVTKSVRGLVMDNEMVQNLNITVGPIIERIADELFSDKTLSRYLTFMLSPISKKKYFRPYKYLQNRFIKVFSDVFIKAAELSNFGHYTVLKSVMESIPPKAFRKVLADGFRRIQGTMIIDFFTRTAMNTMFLPNNTVPIGKFYLDFAKYIYNTTIPVKSALIAFTQQRGELKDLISKFEDILNRFNQDNGYMYLLMKRVPRDVSINNAASEFADLNLGLAKSNEFSGDNKKVCATVYKHNLVREAIFNEEKFEYCMNFIDEFKNANHTKELGSLSQIRSDMNRLMDFKKSFYCSVCDSNDSKNINLFRSEVAVSNEFCFKFVREFNQYLNWRYLKFYEYQNKIYQYLSCYGRPANLTLTYPYESINKLMPEPMDDWDNCKTVTSIDDIAQCANLCSQVKLSTYSAIIDGDRENLKRLYYYGVNTLRQYGIVFGTFDAKKAAALNKTSSNATNSTTGAAATTGSTNKRILEEQERSVRYDFGVADDLLSGSRLLQDDQNQNSQEGNDNNNSTDSDDDEPEFNTTLFNKTMNDRLRSSEEIQMMMLLMDTIEETTTFTRKEHYNHDEISSARVLYFIVSPVNSLVNLTTSLKKNGLNPFNKTRGIRFEASMSDVLVNGGFNQKSEEPLDPMVIKDCVDVNKQDVGSFNEDYAMNFEKGVMRERPIQGIPRSNEMLFARWIRRNDNKWVYPVIKQKPKDENNEQENNEEGAQDASQGGSRRRKARKLRMKETKKVGTSFLENLLFKVWF